jgi:multicomponent Na+:H+ antiporter subunit D
MNLMLTLPLLIPFVAATLAMLAWRWVAVQRWLGIAGAGGQLVAGLILLFAVRDGGIQATQLGDWPAPFGITLVADLFSATMVVITGLMGVAVAIYSIGGLDVRRESFGYYPLLLILLVGVCGAFLTGDIFNLFVWFEVMLIASFVLLALGGERAQLEGAMKYVTINLVSSAFFLSAVGILYGLTGTLNMADLAVRMRELDSPVIETTVAMLLLVVFGIKAAIFPLFFWLPASYHTPPIVVSAIFAGLLTKVGVYALIRVFTLLFIDDVGFTHTIIMVIAGFTMVVGVLGAVAQHEVRRILSFHIVSQIGYMIMGLGLFTAAALAASVFYIVHHIIVKTNLFLVGGVMRLMGGSFELKELGGLYRTSPLLAVLFLVPAMSLAGIPPLSGFVAKLGLVQAGLAVEQYWLVGVALAVSALTLLSMTKIWAEAFWKSAPEGASIRLEESRPPETGGRASMIGPIAALAAITISIGLLAEPLVTLSFEAGEQLMNPDAYIDAVLGEDR